MLVIGAVLAIYYFSGGTGELVGVSEIRLTNDASEWLVLATAGSDDSIIMRKGETSTSGDGTKATTTSDIEIRFSQLESTMSAPATNYFKKGTGELLYIPSDLCLLSQGTGIFPHVFGAATTTVKYSVEVLKDGKRLDYKVVTWGGSGTTPANELSLIDGKVKISNIAQLSTGVQLPSLSDVMHLDDRNDPNPPYRYRYPRIVSINSFVKDIMKACNNERWSCLGQNCVGSLKDEWLPSLNIPSGYGNAAFQKVENGIGTWEIASSQATPLITVHISTELGTLLVKPNVAEPEVVEVTAPETVDTNKRVAMCATIKNKAKVAGSMEIYAESSGGASITDSPKRSDFKAGQEKEICFELWAGAASKEGSATVKACSISPHVGFSSSCSEKTDGWSIVKGGKGGRSPDEDEDELDCKGLFEVPNAEGTACTQKIPWWAYAAGIVGLIIIYRLISTRRRGATQ